MLLTPSTSRKRGHARDSRPPIGRYEHDRAISGSGTAQPGLVKSAAAEGWCRAHVQPESRRPRCSPPIFAPMQDCNLQARLGGALPGAAPPAQWRRCLHSPALASPRTSQQLTALVTQAPPVAALPHVQRVVQQPVPPASQPASLPAALQLARLLPSRRLCRLQLHPLLPQATARLVRPRQPRLVHPLQLPPQPPLLSALQSRRLPALQSQRLQLALQPRRVQPALQPQQVLPGLQPQQVLLVPDRALPALQHQQRLLSRQGRPPPRGHARQQRRPRRSQR